MFISDAPINDKESDLLNRAGFATNIADSIMSINAQEGLCISLEGPWGSGKSSILNLIINHLNEDHKNNLPQIIHFTPWNFITTDQLFKQFFCLLADVFADKKAKRDIKIAEELHKYVGMIDSLSPGIKIATLLANALNESVSKKNPFDTANLLRQKSVIVDLLRKQTRKVIVIIDDLDRLTNDEIRLIFQLVNSVARFPNVIYLLAYDKEIVVNALKGAQGFDGVKYLEKIVQVPIAIPEIKPGDIDNALFGHLNRLISTFDYQIDESYWYSVYHSCISGKLKTLRNVVRLINSLYVKCTLLKREINLVDLIAITFVEQQQFDLYEWIRENRGFITHRSDTAFYRMSTQYDYNKRIREDIVTLNETRASEYSSELDTLFPNWDSQYASGTDLLRKMRRMAHSDFVDRYFCFDIGKNDISQDEIDRFLFRYTYEEMIPYVEDSVSRGNIVFLLDEIGSYENDLHEDRKIIISKALIACASDFDVVNRKLFSIPLFHRAIFRIERLLNTVTNKDMVFVAIIEMIESADINTLKTLSYLLNTIELAHGRLAADGKKRSDCCELINEEQLSKCELSFVSRLESVMKTTNVLDLVDSSGAYMILYLYSSLSDNFNEYMKKVKANKIETLKYVSLFAVRMTGTDGISWSYKDDYNRFVSYEEARLAYDSCLNDGSITELPDSVLTRIIAFALWYDGERDVFGSISDKMIESKKKELLA